MNLLDPAETVNHWFLHAAQTVAAFALPVVAVLLLYAILRRYRDKPLRQERQAFADLQDTVKLVGLIPQTPEFAPTREALGEELAFQAARWRAMLQHAYPTPTPHGDGPGEAGDVSERDGTLLERLRVFAREQKTFVLLLLFASLLLLVLTIRAATWDEPERLDCGPNAERATIVSPDGTERTACARHGVVNPINPSLHDGGTR